VGGVLRSTAARLDTLRRDAPFAFSEFRDVTKVCFRGSGPLFLRNPPI